MRYGLWLALTTAILGMANPVMAADALHGAQVFGRCAVCHVAQKGAASGIGPNLFGVVGRKAASLPDFSYSGPLKSSGITWSNDKLLAWTTGPARMVPGTKMAFAGITSKTDREDLVAYLDTLK